MNPPIVTVTMLWLWSPSYLCQISPVHILQPLPCSLTLSPAVEVPWQKFEGPQKKEGRLQKSAVVQEHVLSYLSNVLVRHQI